jgi:hypothetical protein
MIFSSVPSSTLLIGRVEWELASLISPISQTSSRRKSYFENPLSLLSWMVFLSTVNDHLLKCIPYSFHSPSPRKAFTLHLLFGNIWLKCSQKSGIRFLAGNVSI